SYEPMRRKRRQRQVSRTKCVRIVDAFHELGGASAGERRHPELDLTVVGARNRDAAPHRQAEFGDARFARSPDPRDAVDRDDVAAVDPEERLRIEARLERADREGTEIFLLAIVDIGVVGVGADGVDVGHRKFPRPPALLDPDRTGPPAGAAAGSAAARSGFVASCGSRSGATVGSSGGAAGSASAEAGSAPPGARASGTSESRKAPDTPKATTVARAASALRDSAGSAPTKRETSKHSGSSRIPAM